MLSLSNTGTKRIIIIIEPKVFNTIKDWSVAAEIYKRGKNYGAPAGAGSSSFLWLVHWRALRIQGCTWLRLTELVTRGRWWWAFVSAAFRFCQVFPLQRANAPTHWCCVELRRRAAQEEQEDKDLKNKTCWPLLQRYSLLIPSFCQSCICTVQNFTHW